MAGAMWGVEGSRKAASGFAGVNGGASSGMKRSRSPSETVEGVGEGKVALELRLGLSTNGRFGVDPARKQTRSSSSVSNMVFGVVSAGNVGDHRGRGVHAPLLRASSAPPDARLPEKLRKVKVEAGLHGIENWRSPKGANESRGLLQSDLVKGATQTTATGSSSRHPFLDKSIVKEEPTVTDANAGVTIKNPLKNALFDKPYVSTRALGHHQNKVKGFLYKYEKIEDVKIICVCHGAFLSPAEFVKHGGGSDEDVAYPLKQIIVSPFPFY